MWIVRRLTILSVLASTLCGSEVAIAFDEVHLKKFEALNTCEGCDLSGANFSGAKMYRANLSGANLNGVELSGTILKDASLSSSILCKTLMPWGEENIGC